VVVPISVSLMEEAAPGEVGGVTAFRESVGRLRENIDQVSHAPFTFQMFTFKCSF
jgi:hypothetical protein